MDVNSLNNKIVIVNDNMKSSLLKLISDESSLLNIKIITLSELKKKYFFDIKKEAVFHICKKYNVISDIAKIYLDNIYYLNNKKISNEKISFLLNIKNDLENSNLIIKNKYFKKFLNNKQIVLLNLKYCDLFYKKVFDELRKTNEVTELNFENTYKKMKQVYEAKSIDEEISFVCSNICELIKNNIDINNIKLANVNKEYFFTIKKIFKMFNIPINLNEKSIIKGCKLLKIFKENYSNDIEGTLDSIKPYVKTKKDQYIFNEIIKIINTYSFTDNYLEVKDLLFEEIDNISYFEERNNAINIIDIENELISDDDYVFLINFNEGVIPYEEKDEDFLSDKLKNELKISQSFETNYNRKLSINESIFRIKNIIISYSKYDMGNELFISSLYNDEAFIINKVVLDYNNSNIFNKIELLKLKDDYNKYGSISNTLILLNNHYPEYEYMSYDNSFKKINNIKRDCLQLSYTSLNSFYECGFKYYLNNVLHLNCNESSFDLLIGNVFHKVLSRCFEKNFDFEKCFNDEIKYSGYKFNNMELFFIKKLKNDLLLIIDTIKDQLNYTQLKKMMFEKEIIVKVNEELNITFKGFIDKIIYDEFDGVNIVALVDYKTGNPNININNCIYGLDMQLPIYIYLLKNSNIIKNMRVGGFYLQKIINNSSDVEGKKELLKLQGYSNEDINILNKVDTTYNNSKIIKGLKTTSNGFYSYSKLLNDDGINKLASIVDSKIKEACKKILNNEFEINPKVINNENYGCNYCKFKDICYMKNEDYVFLSNDINDLEGDNDE